MMTTNSYRRFTADEKQEILELRDYGWSIPSLADQFHVPERQIRRIIDNDPNEPTAKQKKSLNAVLVRRIRQLHAEGMRGFEIGRTIGVSRYAVSNVLTGASWKDVE